jgi:hypothetical protein
MPFSALPQDLVPLQEAGSPPATGALLHGPSAPTIVLPHVAQAPCSTIQVYSHRQKKRLKEGDANTSYFYHRVRYKKCKNFIAKLKVGDQIKTEQGKKKRRHGTFTTIC